MLAKTMGNMAGFAPALAVLLLAYPVAGGQAQDKTPTPKVRIDVPKASPKLPNSSVLPAGAGTTSDSQPNEPTKSSTSSPPQSGEFVIAPIPFSNEALSFGLIPVLEYVFHIDQNDRESPPSSLIAAGMLASNSSWAIGGGGRLYLKQDRYRFAGFGGKGTVGYEIFGVGSEDGDEGRAIPIRQGGNLMMLEFLVRVKRKFYIGPRFNYRNLSANLDSTAIGVPPPSNLDPEDLGAEFAAHAPGFKILSDTRSDVFYPTAGHELQFIADFLNGTRTSALAADKEITYEYYQLSYNQYLSLSSTQVMALRGMFCNVTGDPPFYELCQFGVLSDIRGYQPGRYRDRLMFATQGEYRKTLGRHLGFVLFGGVGEVADSWDAFNWENLLPAGGTGIRFNLSKKQRINLRADIAYGKNGWSWNFSLGEAF
jgi:hypothetical protein